MNGGGGSIAGGYQPVWNTPGRHSDGKMPDTPAQDVQLRYEWVLFHLSQESL